MFSTSEAGRTVSSAQEALEIAKDPSLMRLEWASIAF
jgi:hypothetical protein